ncbi:class D beta-lactamase, partial [Streptococcus pyogenes]|uniref:class D beta-lactamase n=1 Tax=Streptococcus pyogenes TaxID=1314 RepID=UPI003DA15D27
SSLSLVLALAFSTAGAGELCTVVMDAKSKVALHWEGNCAERFTPASTFKVPLAVMGFDAGFLKTNVEPALQFRPGEIDWGGEAWRQPTGPEQWMRLSVVWYSQRIVTALGQAKAQKYSQDFGFGNADLRGDPGQPSTLRPAWVSSSLQVSPLEQAQFISRLVTGELPVAPTAAEQAKALLEQHDVEGWNIRGKTGTAFPRSSGGESDETRGWGWYVGWAQKDDRLLSFAFLTQDDQKQASPAGIRARQRLLQKWPELVRKVQ